MLAMQHENELTVQTHARTIFVSEFHAILYLWQVETLQLAVHLLLQEEFREGASDWRPQAHAKLAAL